MQSLKGASGGDTAPDLLVVELPCKAYYYCTPEEQDQVARAPTYLPTYQL